MTSLIHSLISLSHLHLFLFESCHSSYSRLAHASELAKDPPRQCTTSIPSNNNARPSIHYTECDYTQNCQNSNFRVRISERNGRGSNTWVFHWRALDVSSNSLRTDARKTTPQGITPGGPQNWPCHIEFMNFFKNRHNM